MHEFFSFNFPLREYLFLYFARPPPPPAHKFSNGQLSEDVRNSLQNRRFFQFRRTFLAFCRLKKAVFSGIKIEPTKSGIVSTVKSTHLHKRKRGIFSPL